MHDIDRTQRELEMEAEHEHEHEHEHEFEGEHELEAEGEMFLGSLFGEAEAELEAEGEFEFEAESPLNEAQEMELASELLEVSNEAELEYFFGKLFSAVSKGVGNFIKSPTGKMVGGMLKGLAKKALPVAAGALGGYFGGPAGAKIGSSLGKYASGLFEMELEGLSHEDREFEVARRVVRTGAATIHKAVQAPRHASPTAVARHAFTAAARTHAPGLVRHQGGHVGGHLAGGVHKKPCLTCGKRHHRNGHHAGHHGGGHHAGGHHAGGMHHKKRHHRHHRGIGSAGYSVGYGEPGYVEGGTEGTNGYPVATRGGRWYRRGRHIVLTGL